MGEAVIQNPMPDVLLAVDLASNVTEHCPNGTQWIWKHFGECVTTEEHYAAFIIGLTSMLLWVIPLFPQIYENYKRQSTESLSIYFLLFWILGDLTNFVGAVFTQQMPTQVYVAIYYIFQDLILFSQFLYYTYVLPRMNRTVNRASGAPITVPNISVQFVGILTLFGTGASILAYSNSSLAASRYSPYVLDDSQISPQMALGGRKLLRHFFHSAKDEVGYALGTLSAVSYLAGRIPQVISNYRRQDTEGLSLPMFVIIVFGNITYGLSVLLAGEGADFILRHLPWLVGSLGCCTFDSIVIVQIFYYTYKNDPSVDEKDDHRAGLLDNEFLGEHDDEVIDI